QAASQPKHSDPANQPGARARASERDPAADRRGQAAGGARGRGQEHARRGQWTQAAREALAEVAASPGDRLLWSKAAALLVLAGDVDGYRQLCGRMLEQFKGTRADDPDDTVCKIGLLLPPGADRSALPSRT